MRRTLQRLWKQTDGAVAPTVALSLVGLIAVGGIAFDYARMATMHTELQDAADQAALAAASQLDGQSGACSRAAAAASQLLNNYTLFAARPTGTTAAVTVTQESGCDSTGNIKFYKTYDQSTDTPGTAAATAADAKFVIVTVDARTANYALTPIASLLTKSQTMTGTAVATLGSGAVCKVPPLMICNPTETPTNLAFDPSAYAGKGLKLEAGGGTTWAPGNYGYLDFGSGAKTVEQAIGSNVENNPCIAANNVNTEPGNVASAPKGINTRFDIYENGLVAACDSSTGNCSPALDVIKDVIHPQFSSGATPNETAGKSDNCGFKTGSGPWDLPSVQYLPDPVTRLQPTALGKPTSMGSPRDICHSISSTGDCANGRFGDGAWDRNLYFQVNYGTTGTGWQSLSWLSNWAATNGVTLSTISRYNVYRAETAAIQAGTLLNKSGTDAKRRLAETSSKGKPTSFYDYANGRCAPSKAPTATVKDRRLLTAAVVNCAAGSVKGSSAVQPIGWVDLFLVEPSLDRSRTSKDQIYVEVVGGAKKPDGSTAFQYYLRQRPMLIK
ncbi:pilus assembly protein TadG-related protein [Sphingomonas sp.]|uniref:pilus assembly protein TadG-related protein n=1 Tax=Sphingomonas sp. TaxID=28214 RepID=UPI0025EDCB3A|nr:pilus assembly protein TadG-related protein [Sphingomonas sp.]MBV9527437.1 hypothetical protein [Sphingomonas sp.]